MHFICRSFNGKHSDFFWSQYWENEPDDIHLSSQKGHLFGLISFSLQTGDSQITQLGKSIISSINQAYFSSDLPITDSLKLAIDHLEKSYQNIFSQINLILLLVHQGQVYLCAYGDSSAFLIRDRLFSRLNNLSSAKVNIISGSIKDSDKIFLSTNNFVDQIGYDKVKSIFSQSNLVSIEESFLSCLYTLNNQTDLASCVIQIHDDQKSPDISTHAHQAVNTHPVFPSTPVAAVSDVEQKTLIKKSFLQKIFKKDSVYVDTHSHNTMSLRRKTNLVISVLIVLALSLSVYFGYQKNKTNNAQKQFAVIKEEINQKIQSAIAIKNLNLSDAQKSAQDANVLLEQLVNLNVYSDEIEPIRRQIETILSQTGESVPANNQEPFIALSEINIDHSVNKIYSAGNQLILVGDQNILDKIDVDTKKKIDSVSLGISGKITYLSSNGDQIYFLADNYLYLLNSNTPTLKIDFNKSDIKVKDFSFWNGILYVLSDKNIFKYQNTNNNFDNGTTWLKNETTLKPNQQSLSINSSIWTVTQNGQIQSFTRGIEDKINISSNNLPISAQKIITSGQLSYIFVLDGNNNVFVYKTSGEVVSKYNFGDKKILDITVNDKKSILYVLCDDQKVYSKSL